MILTGIPNKREYLARVFERTGLIHLLERAAAKIKPALLVLNYHRITATNDDLFYDPVISASSQSFRMQIEWLRKYTHILTLEELEDWIGNAGSWKEPAAFLTFDDGYRDNFDVAAPILNELNVPATFFISTGFLNSPKLPWWDQVAYTIKKTATHRLFLNCDSSGTELPIVIDLDQTSRQTSIMTLIRAILAGRVQDLSWFLEQLSTQAELPVDSERLAQSLFMSWAQVRQLADTAGRLTIGSHSCSHLNLAKLNAQSLEQELVLSKRILQERLRTEISAFAYPFGWLGTYNNTTRIAAINAGYRLAFTSRNGVNRPGKLDALELFRLGVGATDSLTLLRARAAFFAAFGRSFF